MSHTEIESNLRALQAGLRSINLPSTTVTKEEFSTPTEIPRSVTTETSLEPALPNPESILPKKGAEVISPEGHVHPVVGILLSSSFAKTSQKYRPETQLPIVNTPEPSRLVSTVEGITAPAPSPIKFPLAESDVPFSTDNSGRGKQVLFIYPPNMDSETIRNGLEAAQGNIFGSTDRITICWAGGKMGIDGGVGLKSSSSSSSSQNFNFSSDASATELVTFSGSNKEISPVLKERAPFIAELIYSFPAEQKLQVKLEPRADIKWLVQQELQESLGKAQLGQRYDIVVMPCLPPGKGVNEDLEKFLLGTLPFPVILVRCPI